jgi:DNA-binding CsgD family transcriptional regulator
MSLAINPIRLSKALEALYGATLSPSGRLSLPHAMARAFNAPSSLLHMRECATSNIDVVGCTENLQPFMAGYVVNGHTSDDWSLRAIRTPGQAIFGEEIVPEKELLAADWYHDICLPAGVHHIVGGAVVVECGVAGLIGIQRPADAAPFENDDRMTMQFLLQHLAQAYRLIRIADMNARTNRLTLDALSSLSVGVFIVQANARVRLMNATAEHVVRSCRSIAVTNGRLSLCDPKLDERLRASIRFASLAPLGRSFHTGETIALPVEVGQSLSLAVMPLPPQISSTGPDELLAAVFVGEPSPNVAPSSALLRTLYGLTPTETRLLLALLEGACVSDYADCAGVSLNTARSQLKSIFLKTGCQRQAELIKKIVSDPMLRLAR